jgi:hypothetical protein
MSMGPQRASTPGIQESDRSFRLTDVAGKIVEKVLA